MIHTIRELIENKSVLILDMAVRVVQVGSVSKRPAATVGLPLLI